MPLAGWLTAFAVGLLAGGLAGLIGVGGGVILVPFLYFFLTHPELGGVFVQAGDQAVVAHATSLIAIVFISIRGAYLYTRSGLVDWKSVRAMALASVIAAVVTARLAISVPGELLKLIFGIFLIIVAVPMLVGSDRNPAADAAGAAKFRGGGVIGGGAVGFFSALLGVGGGTVTIPVLIYWLHVPMKKVAGTSLGLIPFTAAAGVLGYAIAGVQAAGDLSGLATYLHLPAAAGLTAGALVAVPIGSRLQSRLSPRALRRLFAVVFFLLGARLVIVNLIHIAGA
jgi:hypothetical protein